MISSDATKIDICQRCGLFGYQGYCQTCNWTRQVTQMTMPYAAKLLVQELISMNVGVRLQPRGRVPHPAPLSLGFMRGVLTHAEQGETRHGNSGELGPTQSTMVL